MIKAFLLLALVATSLSAPQNRYYDTPQPADSRNSFRNQPHRQDSGERFGGGFDSREKFPGGGFRQSSGQRFSGSSERFGGGSSGEVRPGSFAPRPVGGFEAREQFSGPQRVGGGFAGGFRGDSGEAYNRGPVIAILRDERQGPVNGEYSFLYETEDGVRREESGSPVGPEGATVQQGSWSFTFPDGTPADFRFIADENGYQVESNLLPTPHPLPAHAVAQIEKAERERAAGIIHDGQYREEDHFGGGVALQPGRFAPAPAPGRFAPAPAPGRFAPAPAPAPLPAPAPGPFRASGRPLPPAQGFHGGFGDSSHEQQSFRGGDDRYQSSFEENRFSSAQPRFGGGLQPQHVGVPLSSANQRFGSSRPFQGSQKNYN